MAEEKKYDPMADLNPEYLANMDYGKEISGANQSFSQYGDDSSPEYQQKAKGGLNEKYTGEGVKNDQLNYDESLMLKDLNPNFVYGLASKVYGTDHPGYITQRNDQIASALYNEGKTAKDDVAYFLSQQNGWMNSSEADRSNTIEAIYKRLGQIGEQYPKEEEKVDESKADEIVQDNSGTIYGKNTAEEGNPKEGIDTLSDANSPLTAMEAGRANGLKVLLGMSTEDIATSLNAGLIDSSLQSMRDYQTLYPELWEKVKQYQKKLKAQNTVTSIANGTEIDTEDNGQSVINNANADFANSNAGAIKTSQEITQDVNNALAQNQTASEASETMASIEEDMAILKNRLKNLRTEANKAFKGDVPDYLVNAYIANKSQEIQNQMSILEDRYNAAYNRYKTEVANTQWEKEFELKQEELQLKKDSAALEDWATRQNVAINWYKAKGDTSSGTDTNGYEVSSMSDEQIGDVVDLLMTQYENGQLGNAQCATGVQRYYLPMLGISLPNLSDYQNKLKLINEGKSYTPKKGDLIIFSDYGSSYGHMGIVTGVDEFGDGSISYLDWNGSVDKDGNGTQKVQARNIKATDKRIMGYRNINKGQGQTSGGATKEWDDADYTNFTNFLDSNNKDISDTDRASIAEMYGFKDNLAGMRDFASEQLKNRETPETPEPDTETNEELGYDEELGYNTLDTKLYQMYNNDKNYDIEKLAADTGVSVEEARNRIRNWNLKKGAVNKDKLADGMTDSQRDILQKIANGEIKGDKNTAELLGFGGDVELLGQAVAEVQEEEAQKQISDALRTFAELQILFEDADRIKKNGDFDTAFRQGAGWMSSIGRKFDQAKASLLLDKVVKARGDGVTFGSMTEYEWKKLDEAASALRIALITDKNFTKEYKSVVSKLWSAMYGKPGEGIKGPTDTEWQKFVSEVRNSSEFGIMSSKDYDSRREAFDEASKGAESDDANDWISGS